MDREVLDTIDSVKKLYWLSKILKPFFIFKEWINRRTKKMALMFNVFKKLWKNMNRTEKFNMFGFPITMIVWAATDLPPQLGVNTPLNTVTFRQLPLGIYIMLGVDIYIFASSMTIYRHFKKKQEAYVILNALEHGGQIHENVKVKIKGIYYKDTAFNKKRFHYQCNNCGRMMRSWHEAKLHADMHYTEGKLNA